MYPDLAGSGTLPSASAVFSARITFRSQQRTPDFCFSLFFTCSADYERDWPPYKVVFFGLATNALNVRNNQNPNLPVLNKQWQPALLLYVGGPFLPKNTNTSTLPLKHLVPLERTVVAIERATKGHTNDTRQEDSSRCQALASDSLRSSTIV